MKFFQVPLSESSAYYTQSVRLSGATYIMQFQYNTRMQRWIFSLLDTALNPVVSGIAMLLQRSLVSQYVTLSIPPGDLFCYNSTNDSQQPTLYSFLVNTLFIYADPDQ